jgi:hypothetical protein
MDNESFECFKELEARIRFLERAHLENSRRIHGVEKHFFTHVKEAAVRAEATPENLYAPLRSDTRAVVDLAAFVRRLVDMQDLGHAVTEEVRQLALRALGLK